MQKFLTFSLAVVTTGVGLGMAIASALGRADTAGAQALLAAISCVVVLAVHILPSITNRKQAVFVYPIWACCLVLAIWGHAGFFLSALSERSAARQAPVIAEEERAREKSRASIEYALKGLTTRPTAAVAKNLAWAKTQPTISQDRIAAWELELEESIRASKLRDQLVALDQIAAGITDGNNAGNGPSNSSNAVTDTVTVYVAQFLKVSPITVALLMNGVLAIFVEVLGVMFWIMALSGSKSVSIAAAGEGGESASSVEGDSDANSFEKELARLKRAVESGECALRVADIRKHMACGQTRAMELCRVLKRIQSQTAIQPG